VKLPQQHAVSDAVSVGRNRLLQKVSILAVTAALQLGRTG